MEQKWYYILLATILVEVATGHGIEVELNNIKNYVLKETSTKDVDWWKHAVVYQIYPRSFMDSDGDGTGDLNGITSRLEHLRDAGITATWLSPIYHSPKVDQGYDIDNYRAIDPMYGSMEDFTNLLKRAKELGIKVLLDFVPNHTSDQHDWFKLSENRTAGYENFYVWSDNPEGTIPNNWISSFRGSAWTWNEKRGQYYYHAFHQKQPDLNYRDPKVVQEMKDVLTFWMDIGVDGFRIDAVPFLFEDTKFPDEPLVKGRTYDLDDESCLHHIYTQNHRLTYDMVYQWRQHIDNYVKEHYTDTKLMMIEAYATVDQTMLYYGDKDRTRLGAHFPFNFNFIKMVNESFTIDDIVTAIHAWLDKVPEGYTSNWVLGNHDNHRVGSRFGEENVDAFNMITSFLPGVMITYYGDEIGMLDAEVTCEDGQDEQAKANNCKKFNETSRDFERTPFQWDDSVNAGFSTANKTWLPIGNNYKEINLAKQDVKEITTHYTLYKELVQFRKNFQKYSEFDNVVAAKVSDNVLEILRQRDEGEYIMLSNISGKEERLEFIKKSDQIIVAVASGNKRKNNKGDFLTAFIDLAPHECVILVQTYKWS